MAQPRVKSQHYVPQTYLRFFANKDGRLWIFDKPTGKTLRNSVKNVAQERFFYDMGEDDPATGRKIYPQEQPVEKMFHEIEGKFRPVAEDIINSAPGGLNSRHLPYLADFITAQTLRTREKREDLMQVAKSTAWLQMQVDMVNHFPDIDHSQVTPLLPPMDETEVHLSALLSPELWTASRGALLQHTWFIGINKHDRLLHTSDNPVALKGNPEHEHLSGRGVGARGVEIYLPLSPRHVVVVFGYKPSELPGHHLSAIEMQEDAVIFANDLQAMYSYRQVYSLDESFELTAQRVAKTPWSADPGRKRLEVSGGPFGKFEL